MEIFLLLMRMGMINIGIWELVVVEFQMEPYETWKMGGLNGWQSNKSSDTALLRRMHCSVCKMQIPLCVCVYDMGTSSWFFLLF